MDKRYQVFVSSTYIDLEQERQEVMQALLELDCIPSGMELFPAANEDQWTLIKKVIDDCDYYMVIVAGRYGSIGPEGLSYTEMEYRYALEVGKPVLGFVHREPGSLAANRTETSEEGREKLNVFRDLVQKKMCRTWESPADLGSQVSRSLVKLIKSNPGIGWVRGDLVPEEGAAKEILELRRKIEDLQFKIQAMRITGPEGTDQLAQGEDLLEVGFSFIATPDFRYNGSGYEHSVDLTWNDLFFAVSPLMIDDATEDDISNAINVLVRAHAYDTVRAEKEFEQLKLMEFKILDDDFQTIKVQFRALGLITKSIKNRSLRDTATYWTLTPYGDNVMTKLRAIKKS